MPAWKTQRGEAVEAEEEEAEGPEMHESPHGCGLSASRGAGIWVPRTSEAARVAEAPTPDLLPSSHRRDPEPA
jgi:hypothetical protein